MNCNFIKVFQSALKGNIFSILILILLVGNLNAQDTIHFVNSQTLVVKIISIDEKMVKYKKFNTPEGPDYIVPKKSVKSVVYSSGSYANLDLEKDSVKLKKEPWSWLKGQTHTNIILTDFICGFGGIEVEHNFFNSKFGIKIPVSIGSVNFTDADSSVVVDSYDGNVLLNGKFGYYNKNKKFSVGVELYAYVSGKEQVNYFIGPAFGYGQFSHFVTIYPWNPDKPVKHVEENAYYYSFFFKNGVRIQPYKFLNISIVVGTGAYFTEFENDDYGSKSHQLSMEGSLSVGYTF